MKTFCLIALMVVTAGAAAHAQTNISAAPQPLRLVNIYSDSAYLDGIGHTVTNRGNVRVNYPDMNLTCALLIAELPESGGRISHIVAETNVVIDATDSKGQPIHATSDRAVYVYTVQNGVTNETITLTGNSQPQIVIPEGTNIADVIIWDRANRGYRCNGNFHSILNLNDAPKGTNSPPATTNAFAAPKINLPTGADTNFPPGKLDLIPPGKPGSSYPQPVPPGTIENIDGNNLPNRSVPARSGGGF